MNTEVAKYCPHCSSSYVQVGELEGTLTKCQTCGWSGTKEELYAVPFEHAMGNREGVANELYNDLRRLMSDASFMTRFVAFLDRWGFIKMTDEKKALTQQVAKFGAAAASAVIRSVIATRANQERERLQDGTATTTPTK